MAPFWLLFLAALAVQGCSVIESDPRGEWGRFENARSVGSSELPIKSLPWGERL